MTRLRSSTFALCASADEFGGASPHVRPSAVALRAAAGRPSVGAARTARSRVLGGIGRVLVIATAAVLGTSSPAFACPVCFGAEETAMIDGAKLGILVLLAITLTVQGAFVGFFLYLRKRAKQVADIDLDTEWSDLQRASRTS